MPYFICRCWPYIHYNLSRFCSLNLRRYATISTKSQYSFPKYYLFFKSSLSKISSSFAACISSLWQKCLCLMGPWVEDNLPNWGLILSHILLSPSQKCTEIPWNFEWAWIKALMSIKVWILQFYSQSFICMLFLLINSKLLLTLEKFVSALPWAFLCSDQAQTPEQLIERGCVSLHWLNPRANKHDAMNDCQEIKGHFTIQSDCSCPFPTSVANSPFWSKPPWVIMWSQVSKVSLCFHQFNVV